MSGMAGIDIDEEPQLLAQLQLASTSEYHGPTEAKKP